MWITNLTHQRLRARQVHRKLAELLQAMHELFDLIPDTPEDVWVKVDLNDEAEIAELVYQTTAYRNPFCKKYSKVEDAAWGTIPIVLNSISIRELMEIGLG